MAGELRQNQRNLTLELFRTFAGDGVHLDDMFLRVYVSLFYYMCSVCPCGP